MMTYPNLKDPKQLLKFVLGFAVVSFLATAARGLFEGSPKTNRTYLKEIILKNMLEKTAAGIVQKERSSPGAKPLPDAEWAQIEKGLSDCLRKQAIAYEASNDPYLDAPLNSETPMILARRFLEPCGALK